MIATLTRRSRPAPGPGRGDRGDEAERRRGGRPRARGQACATGAPLGRGRRDDRPGRDECSASLAARASPGRSRDGQGTAGPFGPALRGGVARGCGAVGCGQRVCERTHQRGDRVGEGDAPVAHRLAGRSGVGSRTAHSGGVDARCQVAPGPPRSATSMPVARRTSRAQSARDARPPLTRWWIAGRAGRSAMRVLGDQLDDRVGDVRRVGGRADLVADGLSGSPASRARSAARAIFSGKSLPGGPWSQDVRDDREPRRRRLRTAPMPAARRPPSRRRTGWRASAPRPRRVATAVGPGAVEHLVGRDQRRGRRPACRAGPRRSSPARRRCAARARRARGRSRRRRSRRRRG